MGAVQIPSDDDWVGLSRDPLPVTEALEWAHRPDCGAVVLFSGVARDHSSDRTGVDQLEYEAYEAQVGPRLAALAAEARTRWPAVGRLVMMHRIGELLVGDSAVVVVASSPIALKRSLQLAFASMRSRQLFPSGSVNDGTKARVGALKPSTLSR